MDPAPRERIEASLAAFERAHGALVRLHDLDGRVRALLGPERLLHTHPACVRAKAIDPTACTHCDRFLAGQHARGQPYGFWKRCHAGLLEICLPLSVDGAAVGMVFIGPWRDDGAVLPDGALRCERSAVDVGGARLRPPPEPRRRDLLALARPLAALLEAELARRVPAVAEVLARGDRIRAFLAKRFAEPIGLADLAAVLRLSRSRTGQVVRAALGMTFPAALEQCRLERARDLLAYTALPVREVARRCGFTDARYFDRRFRRALGMAPTRWRERQPRQA